MRIARPLHRTLFTVLVGAALALPAARTSAAPNNRLDRDVLPKSQSVRLKLDPSRPDYSGAVHIDLGVAAATDSFRLYARNLNLFRVALRGPAGDIPVTYAFGPAGMLVVRTGSPLAPGDYGLDIDFENDFDTRASGLYRVKANGDWYCFTQFEAIAAREAFPCWDEPEFKIPFQLTLTIPEQSEAVSNTPVEKQSAVGGLKTVVFKRTPPLPSYLVAIAAGPLEMVPIPGMSVPGRVVTVKGATRYAQLAVQTTPPLLAALEKYFGRPYPFEKLDLIAVPEFAAGAMENPGAITYRDELLLMDPATAGVRQRYGLASITAHELAHMWFGDLVTMEWWDDLWLNESFASWMGARITDQVFPQYNVPVRDLGGTQRAMVTDARLSTRAVRKPVDAFENLDRLFDELSYQKGQAVLGMLEAWLGPEVFRRGVLDYLKAHEWRNAAAADLWRALSAASGKDVAVVTGSFLDREGVPLVSVELQPGGQVRLQQRRFLNAGTEERRPVLWTVPVTLKYSDGRQVHTQSVLLAAAEQTVTLEKASSPAWVHPDAGERGYYRWSVPPAALQHLAEGAPHALDARERVGFLGNLAALLDAGLLAGDDYLATLARFAEDPQPEVVSALVDGIGKVYDTFITPALEPSFTIYVRKTLRPALKRFGMTPAKGEPEPVSLMRPSLLSALGVYAHERAVIEWARATAGRYLQRPDSVDASLAPAALNLAARQGDLALFEEYRTRFETARVPAERARFLTALGHFRGAELVEKALDYAMSGPLRPQEILTIPRSLADREEMKERVWNWFKRRYEPIAQRIPPFRLPNLVDFARCCQPLRIEEAKAFFTYFFPSPPGTREELAKVIDSINDCVRLREREGPAVAKYLTAVAQAR